VIWNVLYTKPRSEKKVFERLSEQGIESYCPCQKTLKQWSDRKKWVEEPIFKSYIFIKAPATESEKLAILETPGVVRFLFWLGKPAQVKEEEIEAIQNFLGEHKFVDTVSFDVGSRLNIKDGVLKGAEGIVLYEAKDEVVLRIEKLGMSLVARLSKFNVERSRS